MLHFKRSALIFHHTAKKYPAAHTFNSFRLSYLHPSICSHRNTSCYYCCSILLVGPFRQQRVIVQSQFTSFHQTERRTVSRTVGHHCPYFAMKCFIQLSLSHTHPLSQIPQSTHCKPACTNSEESCQQIMTRFSVSSHR